MIKKDYLDRMVVHNGLYNEVVPGKSLIEIVGSSRVLVEYHKGLLCYSSEKVVVKGMDMRISVTGFELRIAHMSNRQLIICGKIGCVALGEGCA